MDSSGVQARGIGDHRLGFAQYGANNTRALELVVVVGFVVFWLFLSFVVLLVILLG